MAHGWAEAAGVLNSGLATDAEVSEALQWCLDLHSAHVPCESSLHTKLSAALRRVIQYHSDEWMRTQAARILVALGPVTGAMARAIKTGDARAFDDDEVRRVAVSFAAPSKPAVSAGKA